MNARSELETTLRASAGRFARHYPKSRGFERQILQGITFKPRGAPARGSWVRELALACTLLLGAIGLGAVVANSHPAASHSGPARRAPSVAPLLPLDDLQAADLVNVASLVPQQTIQPSTGGPGLVVIGAYADPARTVIIFRATSELGNVPNVAAAAFCKPTPGNESCRDLPAWSSLFSVSDSSGQITAAVTEAQATLHLGDYMIALDEGPHTSADGVAHLLVRAGFTPPSNSTVPRTEWTFTVPVSIHPGQTLAMPAPFQVGPWEVRIEKFEITPNAVRVQALIARARPQDFVMKGRVALVDPTGRLITGQFAEPISSNAELDASQPSSATTPSSTRVNFEWIRPSAGTYQVEFNAPDGSTHMFPVTIGDIPDATSGVTKPRN